MSASPQTYYLPHNSYWPILGSIGLCALLIGFARLLTGMSFSTTLILLGTLFTLLMVVGWFWTVIRESEAGVYNSQVDQSFRWGMGWFIFSEVMFFGAFFGALFYARILSVPWIGGEGDGASTHILLWPDFTAFWPLLKLPDPTGFDIAIAPMAAVGIPTLNTIILLSSAVTVTWAHWGLKADQRWQLIVGLVLTLALGILFLVLQATEYLHAYGELNLKLSSGVYGATFFMLTGFHGAHVTLGAIMLSVMLARSLAGHFTPTNHFAFEASAWYWHFVDLVWLVLFTFVYWL